MTIKNKNIVLKGLFFALIISLAIFLFIGCGGQKKVVFDFNDGSGQKITVTESSDKLSPITPPTRDDSYFGGWWTAPTGGEQWFFERDKIKDGLTLYARWLDSVVNISFEANIPNGEVIQKFNAEKQRITEGSYAIKPAEPSLKGDKYYFLGWSRSKDLYDPVKFSSETFDSDAVLYAHWKPFNVLTFNFMESKTEGLNVSEKDNYKTMSVRDGTLALPTGFIDLSGKYIFDGWYLYDDYTGGAKDSVFVNKDITVYAKWEELVTITFDINAVDGQDVDWDYVTEFKLKKGQSVTAALDVGIINRTDIEWLVYDIIPIDKNYRYAFTSWYTGSDEDKKIFTYWNNTSLPINEDLYIYGEWHEANFYIFDGEYKELFHPVVHHTDGDEGYLALGKLPEKQLDSNYNKLFVGWFYKDTGLEYFGEKVTPYTEFVSKVFKYTTENKFVLKEEIIGKQTIYYAELKDNFTGTDLVVPSSMGLVQGDKSQWVDDIRIDISKCPNLKNLVVEYMFMLNKIMETNDLSNINVYVSKKESSWNNSFTYDWVSYNFTSFVLDEYEDVVKATGREFNSVRMEGFGDSAEGNDSFKFLPIESTDMFGRQCFPKLLESRFMPHYRKIYDSILFCETKDLAEVNRLIAAGHFYGCKVYDKKLLEKATDNYLIDGDELVYYLPKQGDIELKLNGETNLLKIDLSGDKFSGVKKLNKNSIIGRYSWMYDNCRTEIYLPTTIEKIESRAIQVVSDIKIYLDFDCPDLLYIASSEANRIEYEKNEGQKIPDGTVMDWSIYNRPYIKSSYAYNNIITYYINSDYYDNYSKWTSIRWSNLVFSKYTKA